MALQVTILGANSATPAYGRNQSSQLLEVGNQSLLLDCGEGAQMRLMEYKLKMSRINHIFISHLHGDHFLGLFGLLATMNLRGRTEPLFLFGPRGLDEIITVQLRYSEMRLSYPLEFQEVQEGPSYLITETDQFTVHSIPLEHRIRCVGFMVREKPKDRRIKKDRLPQGIAIADILKLKKGKDVTDADGNVIYSYKELTAPPPYTYSYAYCSDTRYTEKILPIIKDVDLLYHETTFLSDRTERAAETYHTTTIQAGTIAKKAEAKKLLIGHFSARYKDLSPVLEETRSVFANTYLALDGQTYSPDFQTNIKQ